MFDLARKVVATETNSVDQGPASCGLLFRHEDTCRQLQQAISFYGTGKLAAREYDGHSLSDAIEGTHYPLLFIEVGESLKQEADRWRYLLSHDIRVVLVGKEDSIIAMREVERLGFYYLLWPASTEQIGDTLLAIREDQLLNRGPHQTRSAMRTGVVGLKGGCGTTLIATELTHVLAEDSGKQVILVDHNYCHSGMSVMLGRQSLERKPVSDAGLEYTRLMDQMSAQNQLFRLDSLINYLGIETVRGSGEELREYNNQLLIALGREANFIVEDYSASVNFSPDPVWLCELLDCLVVVVESSLSSLVQTRPFLETLQQVNESQHHPARIILVLNHARPGSTLDRNSVEQYLQHPVAIELPWVKGVEERLARNQRWYNSGTPLANPLFNLGQIILGKPARQLTLLQRLKALW